MHKQVTREQLEELAKEFETMAYNQGCNIFRTSNNPRRLFAMATTESAFDGFVIAKLNSSFEYAIPPPN